MVEFKSKLEEIIPAKELLFDPTPSFGKYRKFLGHAVCFDEETEILTEHGWKKYHELKEKMLVATLNPKTNQLEYHPIQRVFIIPYKGQMYRLKTKKVDILVTPHHRLFVSNNWRGPLKLKKAKMVFGKTIKRFVVGCKWQGENIEVFTLPSYEFNRHVWTKGRKNATVKVRVPAKQIKMSEWVWFLGLWLAEGTKSNGRRRNYYVAIFNKNCELLEKVKQLLINWGFKINKTSRKDELRVSNKQLWLALPNDKHVPTYVKRLSPKYLKIFLDGYIQGDGSKRRCKYSRNERITIFTSSKRLADDLQEISLKAGYVAYVTKRNRVGKTTVKKDGSKVTIKHPEYILELSKFSEIVIQKRKSNIEEWVDYNGIVWCVYAPPHEIVYVRRNGKPIFSGNSHPAKANTKLLEFLVKKFTKRGDIVLDPMSGTGSTGVVAALHGRNAIQVELEREFYEWMEKARKNVEKHPTLTSKGWIINIRGDARQLSNLLKKEADVIVTSPLYLNVDNVKENSEKCWKKAKELGKRWGSKPPSGTEQKLATSRENISNFPLGNIDAIITSPPYSESLQQKHDYEKEYNHPRSSGKPIGLGRSQVFTYYSDSPNNIGNLPHGSLDDIITSPPYVEKPLHDFEIMKKIAKEQNKNIRECEAKKECLKQRKQEKPTYLTEMLKVYGEMWKVLKPSGLAIIIVRPFIRNKEVIDLPYQTWLLLKKAKFKLIKLYKLRLKNISFWRILYEKKNPSTPKLRHEYILICQKIMPSTDKHISTTK